MPARASARAVLTGDSNRRCQCDPLFSKRSAVPAESAGLLCSLLAAFSLAASHLGGKGVQAVLPESAKPVEPGVDFAQRGGIKRVDAARALAADGSEAIFAENSQVLRYSRLRNREFTLDDRDNLARALLAINENFENPTADGIGKYIEGVHLWSSPRRTPSSLGRLHGPPSHRCRRRSTLDPKHRSIGG